MGYTSRRVKKALETIVYLAGLDTRNYWILKAIYIADKEHLKRYGRQLFNDRYIAMKQGPVPSLAYDLVKCARGDGYFSFTNFDPKESISVPDKYTVKPLREAYKQLFSKSELDCLDYAMKVVKPLSFPQLKKLTHDIAYEASNKDDEMKTEDIIKSLENGKEVLEYLKTK